ESARTCMATRNGSNAPTSRMFGFAPRPSYSPVPLAKKAASNTLETLNSAPPLATSSRPMVACGCTTARILALSKITLATAAPTELVYEPAGVVAMLTVCAQAGQTVRRRATHARLRDFISARRSRLRRDAGFLIIFQRARVEIHVLDGLCHAVRNQQVECAERRGERGLVLVQRLDDLVHHRLRHIGAGTQHHVERQDFCGLADAVERG